MNGTWNGVLMQRQINCFIKSMKILTEFSHCTPTSSLVSSLKNLRSCTLLFNRNHRKIRNLRKIKVSIILHTCRIIMCRLVRRWANLCEGNGGMGLYM
jgi:hypothetical protein